jgi:Spy/CpxP family protein refolding chaperone
MNKWMLRVVTYASIAGSLALLPAGTAWAQEDSQEEQGSATGQHHEGLVHTALELDTLSSDQRTQIQQLLDRGKAAKAPVRQADAQLLTQLAAQVDAAKIDRQALGSSLDAEAKAARAARVVEIDCVSKLHGLLTAAQRNKLVDTMEARLPQDKHAPAELEAFRGDSFDANATVGAHVPGERTVSEAEAKVPGMTADQRAAFSARLRARAARESGS